MYVPNWLRCKFSLPALLTFRTGFIFVRILKWYVLVMHLTMVRFGSSDKASKGLVRWSLASVSWGYNLVWLLWANHADTPVLVYYPAHRRYFCFASATMAVLLQGRQSAAVDQAPDSELMYDNIIWINSVPEGENRIARTWIHFNISSVSTLHKPVSWASSSGRPNLLGRPTATHYPSHLGIIVSQSPLVSTALPAPRGHIGLTLFKPIY